MFQNRWGALLFVGITLVGAVSLIGTEDEDGALTDAAAQIEQQSAEFREKAEALGNPDPLATKTVDASPQEPPQQVPFGEVQFLSADDLIVDPVGIDPTPMVSLPTAPDEPATAGEAIQGSPPK